MRTKPNGTACRSTGGSGSLADPVPCVPLPDRRTYAAFRLEQHTRVTAELGRYVPHTLPEAYCSGSESVAALPDCPRWYAEPQKRNPGSPKAARRESSGELQFRLLKRP